jgi:predicted PurR-regulated permease PerM
MTKSNKVVIEISPNSVILTIGIFLFAYFLFMIRNILAMVLIAFIISAAFSPIINFLTKKKISKGFSVAIVYVLSIIVMLTLLSVVSVPIAKEILKLLNTLPETIADIVEKLSTVGIESEMIGVDTISSSINVWTSNISQNLGDIITAGAGGLSGIANILTNLFGGLVSFISIIAIAIYISLDKDNFYEIMLLKVADEKTTVKLRKLISNIESTLGSWFVGQTFLSLIIGTLAITVYTIIGLPYAGSLALLTALLNIIPNLGPIIALIPAFIISLSTGNPITIIGTLVGSIAIQQLEGNILAPKILSDAVGLPPLLILVSILIGAQLFGIVGVILAVPVSVIAHLFLNYISNND